MSLKSKLFIFQAIFFLFGQSFASANMTSAATNLYKNISQLDNFQANFTQILKNPSINKTIISHGKIWIKKPSFFKWQIKSPNQLEMLANGKKLWIYHADIDQVTVQDVPKDVTQAPYLVLLTGKVKSLTKLFNVKENSARSFIVTPKNESDSLIKSIVITFNAKFLLQQFIINTQTGQSTYVNFINQQNTYIPASYFIFKAPKGADILNS